MTVGRPVRGGTEGRVSTGLILLAQGAALIPALLFVWLLSPNASLMRLVLGGSLASLAVVPFVAKGQWWARLWLALVNGALVVGAASFLLDPDSVLVVAGLKDMFFAIAPFVLLYAVVPIMNLYLVTFGVSRG